MLLWKDFDSHELFLVSFTDTQYRTTEQDAPDPLRGDICPRAYSQEHCRFGWIWSPELSTY